MKKFLVLRLRSIGDTILISPAVRAIKESEPNCEITIVSEPESLPVLKGNPLYDRIIIFDRKSIKTLPFFKRLLKELKFYIYLSKKNYEAVIDFHSGPRTAVMTFFAKSNVKLGFFTSLRRFIYTKVLNYDLKEPDKGAQDRINLNLKLVELLGYSTKNLKTFVPVSHYAQKRALEILSEFSIQRFVILSIAARYDFKVWQKQYYIEVINFLTDKCGFNVLIDAFNRRKFGLDLQKSVNTPEKVFLMPELTLEEYIGIISKSSLFIGGDGGSAHIALSLNIPSILLFGPSPYRIWRNLSAPHIAFYRSQKCKRKFKYGCKTCKYSCINLIKPSDVKQAVELLSSMNKI